ncbi:MAG: RNA polymerase sigma factor, partial [Dongiaceae bacterium]
MALLGDRTRADDLVQDCLERAWSKAHLWRRGNIRGWLFTIMHNVNVNARRRAGRQPALTPFDGDTAVAAVRPAQEDQLAIAGLGEALATLPAEQREVVLLVGLEAFSYAEAAAVLG